MQAYRGYYPVTAEDSARQCRQRHRKLVRNEPLRRHVIDKLACCWSPEQIAGRLRLAGDAVRLSHETIYQFVYSPEGRALELHRHLVRASRRRRPRFARKPRGAKIPSARTIAQRPTEVGLRQEIGHWEADLLIFSRANGRRNLTTLLERRSRLVRLVPNHDRRSAGVIGGIGDTLGRLPKAARRTITFDRGSEFLAYGHLARAHGIEAYFCDPHAPWQKGSVENINGRLRRYLPGETDLARITPTDLRQIEIRMNTTPRKCLGFWTPLEAFNAAAR